MQVLFREILDAIHFLNPISRRIFKWGLPLVISMYFSAAFCYIGAGRIAPFYPMQMLSFDFLESGKEIFGAIFVSALFLQILFLAEKIDEN